MTIGVGGKSELDALAALTDMTAGLSPISLDEYQTRLDRAAYVMRQKGWRAMIAVAGTNMLYFTGTHWHPSERLVAVIVFDDGTMSYICPAFEQSTLEDFMVLKGPVATWEEHENPYECVADVLTDRGLSEVDIGMDEAAPFFVSDGIRKAMPDCAFADGAAVTAACRMVKSEAEIALMQRAKDMTLAVQRATASILREGITTIEVAAFIDQAHRKVGAPKGSYFVIVLFGEATAYPHGVKDPQTLQGGDMVLIDTGCQFHDYISDITRSYVFGEPTDRQRQVWDAEKSAQAAAFEAAQVGACVADVDAAARADLERNGFGPGYKTPGLPHRTGHGIGLDIHEWPYLVGGNIAILVPGMCFSNEPMICVYGEFGVRLEDHFYMTEKGPKWFTEPSLSVDDPFGLEA